jgi:hypothetical protein
METAGIRCAKARGRCPALIIRRAPASVNEHSDGADRRAPGVAKIDGRGTAARPPAARFISASCAGVKAAETEIIGLCRP